MKIHNQISSIILALLFICTINLKSFLVVHFYINQAEIIELFCINKEKPQLSCDGKCHLAKQLVKVDDEKEPPFSPNNTAWQLDLSYYFSDEEMNLTDPSATLNRSWNTISEAVIHQYSSVLSPPPKG